ncbi:MAG: acyl carrier protein [Oscillospiraceae bacterium]|nr:acyl carrier protein [Oscillospiraceae bacterium]
MIFEKVKEIITETLGVDENTVTSDAAVRDLTVDSLEVYDIINSIEEEFDISVPEEAVDDIKTVGDIVSYIENCTDAE